MHDIYDEVSEVEESVSDEAAPHEQQSSQKHPQQKPASIGLHNGLSLPEEDLKSTGKRQSSLGGSAMHRLFGIDSKRYSNARTSNNYTSQETAEQGLPPPQPLRSMDLRKEYNSWSSQERQDAVKEMKILEFIQGRSSRTRFPNNSMMLPSNMEDIQQSSRAGCIGTNRSLENAIDEQNLSKP